MAVHSPRFAEILTEILAVRAIFAVNSLNAVQAVNAFFTFIAVGSLFMLCSARPLFAIIAFPAIPMTLGVPTVSGGIVIHGVHAPAIPTAGACHNRARPGTRDATR